ncbi:MAG: DUF3616 domain-containing protein [Fibrobacterota bacterium]|nr:DUF3616 domain-containing protein [Chitinispirillaceae bacterium]
MKRLVHLLSGSGILFAIVLFISGSRFIGSSGSVEAKNAVSTSSEISKSVSHVSVPADSKNIIASPGVTSTPIEASGITYVDNMNSFLIVSDDTEDKRPDIFVMDTSGRITSRQTIKGIDKINDMESVLYAGPDLFYTLTSQSYNKNGKQPLSRTLFVRFNKKGSSFEQTGSVSLCTMLLEAASTSKKEKWAQFILKSSNDQSIDIEGMTIFNDTLLLGFKNPKLDNRAVILALANFNTLFSTGKIVSNQVSVWRTLPLFDKSSSTFCGISDLAVHGDKLYGVSTGVSSKSGIDEDIGLFWKYSPSTDSLVIIRNFKGLKPEGVTIYGNPLHYCIVFDNGTKSPSQFMKGKGAE